jgi:hypothetical protein
MKRRALFCAMLLLAFSMSGCQFLGLTSGKKLDEVYQPAFQTCTNAIPQLFPDKVVNTSVASVRYLNQREYSAVTLLGGGDPETFFRGRAERFWVFTIGNSSGFDYVQMVCSSQTDELVGFIPTP